MYEVNTPPELLLSTDVRRWMNSDKKTNNMFHTIIFRRLFVVTATGLAFAGLTSAKAKDLQIVFSPPNMAFPWTAFTAKVAQEEGKKLGVVILVQDGQGSSSTQSSNLRNAINQGVDGVVLTPNDVAALVPAVNDVIDANIPLVTVDRYIENAKKPVPHFGVDNVLGGAKMAKLAIDKFPDGFKAILLTGEPGASPAIDRAKGIKEAVKAAGDKYKIVAEQTANWSRATGLSVTQNILTSLGTPPDVIFASNDDMALGALQALSQAGVPKGKVMVIGYDAIPEGLVKVRDGELAATVEQLPGQQVKNALDHLVAYLKDKKALESMKLEPVLLTKDNVTQAERWGEVK
jgi:inositol transport system substrate-binding protein